MLLDPPYFYSSMGVANDDHFHVSDETLSNESIKCRFVFVKGLYRAESFNPASFCSTSAAIFSTVSMDNSNLTYIVNAIILSAAS